MGKGLPLKCTLMSFNYDQLTRWDALEQFLFLLTWHLGSAASFPRLFSVSSLLLSICVKFLSFFECLLVATLIETKRRAELRLKVWDGGVGDRECLILIKFPFPQNAPQAAEPHRPLVLCPQCPLLCVCLSLVILISGCTAVGVLGLLNRIGVGTVLKKCQVFYSNCYCIYSWFTTFNLHLTF